MITTYSENLAQYQAFFGALFTAFRAHLGAKDF